MMAKILIQKAGIPKKFANPEHTPPNFLFVGSRRTRLSESVNRSFIFMILS